VDPAVKPETTERGGLYLGIEWILIYARKINVKGGELVLDGSLKTAGT
jgi:hypothetical protein